jgi:glycosyltransferase involved in cell wall biosynthesis
VSRRVLVITYFFPPLGGVGVQRTLKYVKYLPANGWQPVVVTPAKPAYTVRDETLLDQLAPDLRVERTSSFEPAALPSAVAGYLRRRHAEPTGSATVATLGPAGGGRAARVLSKGMGLWKRAWGAILFPDFAAGWIGAATRRGLAVHKSHPFDVVYSTSAPISGHIIAARIAAKTGLPWVADFRDPWIGNAFAPPAGGLTAVRQRRLERKIVEKADLVVFATDGLLESYAARYPEAAAKMRVIPNGYDRADVPQRPEATAEATPAGETPGPAARPFRLVYTGSLFGDRELSVFLEGLDLLVDRRPEVASRLEVEFVGWLSSHNRTVAAQYSASGKIGPMLRFSGFMPRAEAMRKAVASDALLQLIADDPRKGEVQGGKLMEYLGYDRQILAVVPEGQARQLLRELDWGIIADPTPQGVAAGLEQLLAAPAPTRRADPEGRYDRVNLAGRLAGYLDEVAGVGAAT